MKKLLAVMLVLGMVSIANASIELYVNGAPVGPLIELGTYNDTISLGIGNQEAAVDGDYGAYLDILPLDGRFITGPGVLTAFAPGDSSFAKYEADYGYGLLLEYSVNIVNFTPGSTIPAGEHFNFDYTSNGVSWGPNALKAELWDGDNLVDTLVIYQTPEPMTMSLLGIGGLALLRHRR